MDRNALPLELWENVILALPSSEIPSMRLLNRKFCELVDNSPTINYYLDLFSAGLEERPAGNKLTIQDRRQKLEAYCSRWERFDRVEPVLLGHSPFLLVRRLYVDKGFFAYFGTTGDDKESAYFIRLPSPTMEVTRKEWMIRGLPGDSSRKHQRSIHPPSDLLIIPVLSTEERSFRLEMFRMSDGKPHPSGTHSDVMGRSYNASTRIIKICLQVTSCRLAARVSTTRGDGPPGGVVELFVWDWRTGKKCLEYTKARLLTADFIDEYRLIGAIYDSYEGELMLWDSSHDCIPSDHPGLVFESGPDCVAALHQDPHGGQWDHPLPFYESPSMGITALVVRMQTGIVPVRTLTNFAHMTGTVDRIPWEDWKHHLTPLPLRTHLLHSHALNVRSVDDSAGSGSILRVHDFSRFSRRREVRRVPSAPLPPYTVREFQLDVPYYDSSFDFTEGGVLVTTLREGQRVERRFWAI